MKKPKDYSKRIDITIPMSLLAKIDKYRSEHGITRSGLFKVACIKYLKRKSKQKEVR